jgi:hypothetical protein
MKLHDEQILLTRDEFSIDGSLHNGTLTREKREQSRGITHSIQIDQVLVSPILSEGNSIGKPMILSHAIASARVLSASDGFCERYVHDIGVQVTNWDRSFDPMIASRWVGKDDVLADV